MTQILGSARALLLASGVVVLGLSASESNPAQAKQFARKLGEPQKQSNMQLVQAIHMLQSIKKTLEGADHDYGGHRADAVRDIGKAEKQLREALHAVHKMPGNPMGVVGKGAGIQGKGGAGNPGKGNAHPEPQALSNAQLAAAIPALEQVGVFLQKADHDYGGHRAAAVADLGAAITQLGTALKYAQAKDQKKP